MGNCKFCEKEIETDAKYRGVCVACGKAADSDPMMLRFADGTPYMNGFSYWNQRTSGGTREPRLNYSK